MQLYTFWSVPLLLQTLHVLLALLSLLRGLTAEKQTFNYLDLLDLLQPVARPPPVEYFETWLPVRTASPLFGKPTREPNNTNNPKFTTRIIRVFVETLCTKNRIQTSEKLFEAAISASDFRGVALGLQDFKASHFTVLGLGWPLSSSTSRQSLAIPPWQMQDPSRLACSVNNFFAPLITSNAPALVICRDYPEASVTKFRGMDIYILRRA